MTNKSHQYEYAGFWVRFLAICIDFLVLIGVGIVLRILFENQSHIDILQVLIGAAYFVGFHSYNGQTLGKQAMGIKVISQKTGGIISPARAFGRYAATILSSILLFAGYIWVAFDEQKRSWHDMLARTFVVYTDE